MEASKEDTFNVMTLALGMAFLITVITVLILWFLTNNSYLDYYFTLEAFFNSQNTAASEALAAIAFSGGLGRMLTILVIVIVDNLGRIFIVSFIIAAVIDFLNYANVESLINGVKAGMLKNHVILCGYNELADRLIQMLKQSGTKYVVIEPNRATVVAMDEKHILNIEGDFTSVDMLKAAGIARARAITFTSDKDIDNVTGSLLARRLNPKIKIMSRLNDEGIRKKVYGIGTDMSVIPEHLAGIEIGEYIAKVYGGGRG